MWRFIVLTTTVLASPACFYCSTQPGKQMDITRAGYTGLFINIEELCEDICGNADVPLNSMADCQHWAGEDSYFAFDDRV